MELFDRHSGSGRGLDDVADESLVLEHTGQAVLRPQMRGQPRAVGPDQHELHLVADQRLEAGVGQTLLDRGCSVPRLQYGSGEPS